MPANVTCPKCQRVFPVAEARQTIGIECPKCEAELTVEFRKPTAQPNVPVRVALGYPLSATAFAALAKKPQVSTARGRMKQRTSGSMTGVMVAGLGTLLLSVSGLGATGYYLFNNLDGHHAANTPIPTKRDDTRLTPLPPPASGGSSSSTDVRPISTPPKSDKFDLRPVIGVVPTIAAPTLAMDPTTIDLTELGGAAGAVAVGGGGRYLVMHFPEKGMLNVFDFSEGRFLGGIAIGNGDVKLAAGLSRVVVSSGNGGLRVYSLPTLERRYEGAIDLPGGVSEMAMGNRTDGPLLVSNSAGDLALIELTGSSLSEIKEARRHLDFVPNNLRASPDGTAFISSSIATSAPFTHNVKLFTEVGRDWQITGLGGAVSIPGPDGNFYGNLGGAMDRKGQLLSFAYPMVLMPGRTWFVPALTRQTELPFTQQGYLMRINAGLMSIPVPQPAPQPVPQPVPQPAPQPVPQPNQGTKPAPVAPPRVTYVTKPTLYVTIHSQGTLAMLPNVPMLRGVPEFEGMVDSTGIGKPNIDQHFFLVPEAKLLVILSGDRTKLVIRKLNI